LLISAMVVLVFSVPIAARLLRPTDAKKVEAEKVEPRSITPMVLASGTLVFENQVTLVSEVLGRVESVLVKEGDKVVKGQLLLQLDAQAARAEIAQLSAGRRQSELNIERQEVNRVAALQKSERFAGLHREGLVEANKFEEIETQRSLAEIELRNSREAVRQAEAQLAQSRERLAKTEIRAPINGTVTSVFIKSGETAVPSALSIAGSNLLVISDTSTAIAEINVDETDIARVEVNQLATIVPAAYPGVSIVGVVHQVALSPKQQVTGQGRSYPVRIRLQPSEVRFRPGMTCRAEIAAVKGNLGARNLSVPLQAVLYEESDRRGETAKASVFLLRNGRALRRDIEAGLADDQHIEVLKGLEAADMVIVGPPKTLRSLRDGETVSVLSTGRNP
jgi:HlyD family secretion protein